MEKNQQSRFLLSLLGGHNHQDEDKAQVKRYLPDTHPAPQRATNCPLLDKACANSSTILSIPITENQRRKNMIKILNKKHFLILVLN